MDLPSPPATPREHSISKLSAASPDSAQNTPPIVLDVRLPTDKCREVSHMTKPKAVAALKRRSKSEENLATLMHRNVFGNSHKDALPVQLKSTITRSSLRRRHSSYVEMHSKESMRIATIYGWVMDDAEVDNEKQSAVFNVLLNPRSRRRATTTAERIPLFQSSVHPLDIIDNQPYTRQRTRSSGWAEPSKVQSKFSQDSSRSSRRRSLYATRSTSQASLTTGGGKLSKLLVRRRKLGRLPISKSTPSLLSRDHHSTSYLDQQPTMPIFFPASPIPRAAKDEASGCKSNLSIRSGKTASVTDVLLAAEAIENQNDENEHNNYSKEKYEKSRDIPERPIPPVENDPHVFDLLEKVNPSIVNYITPLQTINTEFGSSTKERMGSTPTAGSVLSAATIEKLIERLTSDIDSNFLLEFFLTFRQFTTPVKLCKLLILRFRWALMEESDVRRLVRIRTFVVLRYWMTYFWVQDFKPSRTLRFILSTFLSQLRTNPAVVSSERDTRIIKQLRTIFKKQRKAHRVDDHESDHPARHGEIIVINETDETMEMLRSGVELRANREERKDSVLGLTSGHRKNGSVDNNRDLKPSLSTPVVPVLKRSRRMSENSRGVNDTNEWTARLTYGLRSVKRTVPAMYRSIVEGFSGNTMADEICKCGDTQSRHRVSGGSDEMPSLQSNVAKSRSETLNPSYNSRRAGKASSHVEKSFDNELRLYAPRPRPSQSLTEAPRSYSEFTGGSDGNQAHPNPACPFHMNRSPSTSSASYLQSSISKGRSLHPEYESTINGSHIDTTSIITSRSPHKPFILQHRSEIIMQQFCLIEEELLQRVTWDEIVEMRWKKTRGPGLQRNEGGENSDTTILDCHIDAVIEWFNVTYIWVISEIVSVQALEVRVQVIEKFVRIALKCYRHRNYSTLLQILLGLQSPYVSRLHKTWHRVDQYERQIFEKLKDLPNPERNWKRVRNCMNNAVEAVPETQAVETILSDNGLEQPYFLNQRGSIPFLGLYLADMTSNAEMPTFIPNAAASDNVHNNLNDDNSNDLLNRLARTPLVNYNKFRITASVVKHVLAFQLLAKCYQFERYEPVYNYLKHMNYLDNDDIRVASFQCE